MEEYQQHKHQSSQAGILGAGLLLDGLHVCTSCHPRNQHQSTMKI